MKKLLLTFIILISTTVMAENYHQQGHWERRGGNWSWVAPVVVGGVIGYEVTQMKPSVVVTHQQQPNVIKQPPMVQKTNCSPWTEIRNRDGTVTVTRTCMK